jgi:diadenosine tetraphosphate (Ap4A) HIT family hydrolase
MACELCGQPGGEVLWKDALCRVVSVDEPGYPGFCRVVWNAHVKEMSDLAAHEQAHLMRVVFAVESSLRALMDPAKINLASLGNLVPHLHWHVIPRFRDDPHFPQPIWAPRQREPQSRVRALPAGKLAAALTQRLA